MNTATQAPTPIPEKIKEQIRILFKGLEPGGTGIDRKALRAVYRYTIKEGYWQIGHHVGRLAVCVITGKARDFHRGDVTATIEFNWIGTHMRLTMHTDSSESAKRKKIHCKYSELAVTESFNMSISINAPD